MWTEANRNQSLIEGRLIDCISFFVLSLHSWHSMILFSPRQIVVSHRIAPFDLPREFGEALGTLRDPQFEI